MGELNTPAGPLPATSVGSCGSGPELWSHNERRNCSYADEHSKWVSGSRMLALDREAWINLLPWASKWARPGCCTVT